ncbi:hypothetical protein SLEP1_g4146 [Rubroshorea leprosula]|uniref:Uncharacterized protein n=1 Tax=Rubroshorea leprosula TaxID=152421 RepID=A0AAV5HTJ1_9ROSI|nr:hypothetical protein SLEP1_g4146 [Rubroshorea leprosula]
MGGVCSGGLRGVDKKLQGKNDSTNVKSAKSLGKQKTNSNSNANSDGFDKWKQRNNSRFLPSFSRELKPSTPARTAANKNSERSSFLGRAGIVGLERAVDVLDTLGSSVSNLNAGHSFVAGVISRGKRISILAFEVANTIAKGVHLLQSLSEENINFVKKDVFYSEGVQKLVSRDIKELLSITAADKRDELDVFSREVTRFGDLCKDPHWHNLGRYFSKLNMDNSVNKRKQEAEMTMQGLATLAHLTSELYHELNALDRFEQDYKRKLEEVASLNLPKGESLMILHSELKQQRKLVKSLKKKSLWSRTLEEIVEKLVYMVTYMQQAISEAFGGVTSTKKTPSEGPQRLGVAGLALHYANVISQIDNIASRPTFFRPNMRDTLYHGLPTNVKKALRSRLLSIDAKEKLSISKIKDEMEKTLRWLFPIATNTIRAHQGFGWVGEWANNSTEYEQNAATNNNPTRLQTLYHADKQKTDVYILELVTLLHHLISIIRQRDHGFKPQPARSPNNKGIIFQAKMNQLVPLNRGSKTHRIELSQEDRNLLDKLSGRRLNPGISKSQEFPFGNKKKNRVWALSMSTRTSPERGLKPRMSLDHQETDLLDMLDGLDSKS